MNRSPAALLLALLPAVAAAQGLAPPGPGYGVNPPPSPAPQLAPVRTPAEALNEELQAVWDRLRPQAEAHLRQQVGARLAGLSRRSGKLELKIRRVRSVRLDLATAPGLTALAPDRLALRVPRTGAWAFGVELDAVLHLRWGRLSTSLRLPVGLTVDRVSLASGATIDAADPTRPVIQRVDTPQVELRIGARSQRRFQDFVLRVLSPIVDRLARGALADALQRAAPSLAGLAGLPGPVPGDRGSLLTDSGTPVPLRQIVRGVDRKLRRDHMPSGTVLVTIMDTPTRASWLDTYGPGGAGNPGRVVGYGGNSDSAIFTGMHLAGQAFRHHQEPSAEALDAVRHALEGIGNLLDVYGATGLLAREAAPEGSLQGQTIAARGPVRRATIRGQTWIAREDNGVSRDQYAGVFYGLCVARDLVADPAVRAECGRRLRQMLDYLIAGGWFVDEDRPALFSTARGRPATWWAGTALPKLTYLLMGERVAPGAYARPLAEASPLAETAWLGLWFATFNHDGYYKFNLSHLAFFNYFRLETDPGRWRQLARGFRFQARYTGRHHNPHLDLIQASVDPSLRTERHPGVREALRRFVTRSHRMIAPAVIDLSQVTWVPYTLPTYDASGKAGTRQVQLPSEPIDIPLRKPTRFFVWQRGPYQVAQPSEGSELVETAGLGLTLPYWAGRYQGAF